MKFFKISNDVFHFICSDNARSKRKYNMFKKLAVINV